MALFEHGVYRTVQQTIATDTPCLLMLQHLPNKLLLSVANPDLAFYQGPPDEQFDAQGRRIERSVYSRTWIEQAAAPSTVNLQIEGHWHISPNTSDAQYFAAVYNANNNSTTLTVLTQHGFSRQVELVEK